MSDFRSKALGYYEYPAPGKISISPTKPFTSAKNLSLAYTPGVAEPVPREVLDAYDIEELSLGKDYIIPTQFDPRLIERIRPKVVKAVKQTTTDSE